jgi:hypothetical protein
MFFRFFTPRAFLVLSVVVMSWGKTQNNLSFLESLCVSLRVNYDDEIEKQLESDLRLYLEQTFEQAQIPFTVTWEDRNVYSENRDSCEESETMGFLGIDATGLLDYEAGGEIKSAVLGTTVKVIADYHDLQDITVWDGSYLIPAYGSDLVRYVTDDTQRAINRLVSDWQASRQPIVIENEK